ncbi:MAG: DUF484 family protein [Alphaproteobacteria bacterium]|nr:DUF484 family protein [Alphaproteobacteria bacterium]
MELALADRPYDQPKPLGGESSSSRASAIGAADVIAYLREHPDFLDRHPDALHLLRAPNRSGDGVLDFQHFMLERLRGELQRAQDEHKKLIALSRGNLAGQCRVHKATLALLKATGFEHLLQIVTTDLAVLIDVDAVTLGIESTAARTARMPLPGIRLLRAGVVDHLLGPDRDVLLCTDVKGDPTLFGAAAGLVRSQALVRLSFGRAGPAGLMCIGTRRAGTFHPGLGTELLNFLARAVAITIGQWLERGR